MSALPIRVMSALPIRVRLTLPFAFAMAFVLAALGLFVYERIGSTLLGTIDAGLDGQIAEVRDHAQGNRTLLDRDALDVANVAQVIGPNGRVLESQPAGLGPLVKSSAVADARTHDVRLNGSIRGLKGSWRLLAAPLGAGSPGSVVILGRSLGARAQALDRLRHELLLAAPAALLLATLAGYLLAGAALRPVEAMRRRAQAISAETPGRRLPVPAANDEVSRLATTLNEMLDRLEAALQHERRFVSDASHELRTPLALLRTELELALRRPRSPAELEDAIRSAAEETERLTRLAEDLLLIARADQGALPVRAATVSTADLLETVRSRFETRAERSGRELTVESADTSLLVADPDRLGQALGNLVDNALVHGTGRVTLNARVGPAGVELHVLDEGPGISPEFSAHAFDRFSRADEARGRGGSGLGLAIVQAIAEAHGGTAALRSRPGGGADGWISLPLEAPKRAKEPSLAGAR